MDARRRTSHERRQGGLGDAAFHFGNGLRPVRDQLERILDTDRRLDGPLPPILLLGETGTGKSTLARMIHDQGPRADQPFIEINCSALPESLVEAELFGHERGAFTDAREARIGLFEAAGHGTLLLDEVSSLPLAAQAKILTAIERRVIRRVGSSHELGVHARIIAASLEDLERKAAEQTFRADLYHRLHVLGIEIPPLRSRPGDILPLAHHLLGALKKRYRAPAARISRRGEERLTSYPWPGNVRELDHEIERQLVLSGGGELDFAALDGVRSSRAGGAEDWLNPDWRIPDEGFSIEDAMHRLIKVALDQTGGNLSAAARLLSVNRDYIRYRLGKRDG
jgi:DNA-binding NtrC family response regulator